MSKKPRTTPLKKGDAIRDYAENPQAMPDEVHVPGKHGFRVIGKVGVFWHKDEGVTLDLWGNRRKS